MSKENLKFIIEGILFAVGDPVSISSIASAVEEKDSDVKTAIQELQDEYDYQMRGMKILILENKCQMVSRSVYFDYIKKFMKEYNSAGLSQAALETLAIVAYRQPVTRPEIEQIRGVKSSSSIELLSARGLVKDAGRLDVPGKPICFETTEEFLKLMHLSSIKELPHYEEFYKGIQTNMEELL